MDINIILLGDENTIGRGNRREQLTQCLSCCEKVKRIDVSKRSRKTMDRDGEGGSGDGASITSETLLPGAAPMSTLCAGHHVLVGPCGPLLTITNASSIHHTQPAIALRSSFLWVERMMGGA